MIEILRRIYRDDAAEAAGRIEGIIGRYSQKSLETPVGVSERTTVLITYGDTLIREGEAPLKTLTNCAAGRLQEVISTVHILPFFPYSSDDGFSVTDFFQVNPALGGWDDVKALGNHFFLMFDYVLNHVSAESGWFSAYLEDRPGYSDLAIEVSPETDLSTVVRPRSTPLLTPFSKGKQPVHVWTTFSADQVDLNYKTLAVLEKMIEVMLYYVAKGASVLRMDAVAYLWKEIGTSCIHLPQTHDLIRLFRAILDRVAPGVQIITETNVPHKENTAYFGNGRDQAHMVYNFTLPPMLCHAFFAETADYFLEWADTLKTPGEETAFFNFTASHDGIGVRPLEGILPEESLVQMIQQIHRNGGVVSEKSNPDGSKSPYELNITYIDALARCGDDAQRLARRFISSQAVQFALPGVPAVYIHSLLGTRNWREGMEKSGIPRRINRRQLQLDRVTVELNDPNHFRAQVFFAYANMIKTRRAIDLFHPNAGFRMFQPAPAVIGIHRFRAERSLYCLTNVSGAETSVSMKERAGTSRFVDRLTGQRIEGDPIRLFPDQTRWLTPEAQTPAKETAP